MIQRQFGPAPGRIRWRLLGLGAAAVFAAAMLGATLVAPTFAQSPAATPAPAAPKPDPSGIAVGAPEDLSGVTVGNATLSDKDIAAAKDKEPFAYNLAGYVNQNRLAINFIWTLVTGYPGHVHAGGLRPGGDRLLPGEERHARHDDELHDLRHRHARLLGLRLRLPVRRHRHGRCAEPGWPGLPEQRSRRSHIAGTSWGLFGYKGFFLGPDVLDVGVAVLFLFQMVFMDTAATIPTGAMAERWKWISFCVCGVLRRRLHLPDLRQLGLGRRLAVAAWRHTASRQGLPRLRRLRRGARHGGWARLAGAIVLGPRLGKYNKDGSANSMPGHNLNMAAVGCFILAFGWFGFNPAARWGRPAAATCASARSPRSRCWPARPRRSRRCSTAS